MIPSVSKPPVSKSGRRSVSRFFDRAAGYLFISPWLIGFLGFTLLPMAVSFYLSLTRYNVISPPVFVGLKNYAEIFTNDDRFISALQATLVYVFVHVPLKLLFSLAVAMLLYKTGSRIVSVYRALFYLPSIIGGSVAIAVMWRRIFGVDGIVNDFLGRLGLIEYEISWLGQPSTAMGTLILLGIWQFGSPMLIFLAGLKQIPDSYYEAAAIDGCGWWGRLWRITLPLLTPILFFNLLMQLIRAFMCFTEAFIITEGGPMDRTLFYVLYLYQKSFKYFQMGYGCALAWILLAVIGLFTLLVFRSSQYWVFYESKDGAK
ncbi:MAG: sugar ABC transporter permease [Provencibacterium sp.]|jgi:multiple sugar transport system permease protein|nr:sugar ABC transporter permease [Provencibacterium sp.]